MASAIAIEIFFSTCGACAMAGAVANIEIEANSAILAERMSGLPDVVAWSCDGTLIRRAQSWQPERNRRWRPHVRILGAKGRQADQVRPRDRPRYRQPPC